MGPEEYLKAAEQIDGWMNRDELKWLIEQASKCKDVVEFGAWKGRSTKALTACSGKVYTFDPFNGGTAQHPTDPLQTLCFAKAHAEDLRSGKIIAFPAPSCQAPLHRADPVDMVFIDGAHQYEAVVADIEVGRHLLRNGGLLCGHDFSNDFHDVQRAVMDKVEGYLRAPGGDIWFKILRPIC